jgi:hypothetical protein
VGILQAERNLMPVLQIPQEDTMLILGEIRGQLRELIHNSNNNAAKLDSLSIRVAALEGEKDRREGASGVLTTVLKSPLIGWLTGAAISAWAILTGRVHI